MWYTIYGKISLLLKFSVKNVFVYTFWNAQTRNVVGVVDLKWVSGVFVYIYFNKNSKIFDELMVNGKYDTPDKYETIEILRKNFKKEQICDDLVI